jgi:hypothetical protein
MQKSGKKLIWASWATNGRFGVLFKKSGLGPSGKPYSQFSTKVSNNYYFWENSIW